MIVLDRTRLIAGSGFLTFLISLLNQYVMMFSCEFELALRDLRRQAEFAGQIATCRHLSTY